MFATYHVKFCHYAFLDWKIRPYRRFNRFDWFWILQSITNGHSMKSTGIWCLTFTFLWTPFPATLAGGYQFTILGFFKIEVLTHTLWYDNYHTKHKGSWNNYRRWFIFLYNKFVCDCLTSQLDNFTYYITSEENVYVLRRSACKFYCIFMN